MNYCPSCFGSYAGGVCSACGYNPSTEKKYQGVLPPSTMLNNRYLLGRVLGRGGFGITYKAMDTVTGRICCIKEFMPSEYCMRNDNTMCVTPMNTDKAKYVFNHGKQKYREEASNLRKLQNNVVVVNIYNDFDANNTSYIVMEFLDGEDLRHMAQSRGGKIDADFAKQVFVQIASSLMEVHKLGILHRDISPDNIIYTKDGQIKLIDFGAARNFVSMQNKGMSILLKPGYAPPEQYNTKGNHGPWCDVYALCATYYKLVSNCNLVDAMFRYRGEKQPTLAELGCNVSKRTSDVIKKGMELDVKDRYKDFSQLLNDIDMPVIKAPAPAPAPQPQPHPVQIHQPTPQPRPVQMPKPATTVQPAPQPHPVQNHQPQPVAQSVRKTAYVAVSNGFSIYSKTRIPENDYLKIGRSPQFCQLPIAGDTNISRTHCGIKFDGTDVYIMDTSVNGTFLINGMRLPKNTDYPVQPGTSFYLATRNHMFTIVVE